MWTIELRGKGTAALAEVDRPLPSPGPGQVRVEMKAVSLNYRDLALMRGDYGGALQYPLVPLSDGAGRVAEIGEGVSRWKVGDRVLFAMRPAWHSGRPTRQAITTSLGYTFEGTLTEQRLAREDELVRTPAHLDDEEAATLPTAGGTAWTALMIEGRLRPGEWVVVQGTGGVSIFALQIAHSLGARTVALTGRQERLRRLRELGADHVFDYRQTPDWDREVVALTGGEGAEHVLNIGGAETLDRSLEALRPGGHVYLVGFLGGQQPTLDLPKVFRRVPHLHGLSVGPRSALEEMGAAMEVWGLHPVVDRVFERRDVAAAFDYLAAGTQLGKIVIRV